VVILIAGVEDKEYFASGHRACAGCGEVLMLRHALKSAGENTIVVCATGCMEIISSPYPYTSWKVPWLHGAFENAASMASGVDAALKAQKRRDKTNLLVIGGDGASFDIGFGVLSGAIERGHKFTYIAQDNEAYSNTGVQRSGATFPYASTTTSPAGSKSHGKREPKKPLSLIIASHGVEYVATASPANIIDWNKKVKKALKINGPSFLHAYSPCPLGWRIKSNMAIEISRLAVNTRVFPIYEIENGILKFNQKIENPEPVENYLKPQGRFKHLTPADIKAIQKYVNDRYNFLLSIEGKKVFDVLY